MTAIMPFGDAKPLGSAFAETAMTAPALAAQWDAVHAYAAQIAGFAQLATETPPAERDTVIAKIVELPEPQRALVQHVLADMDAMLEPGVKALGALHDQGKDVTAPALTLWREFYRTRQAMLDLVNA
jgi:hypothetical protein